MELNLDVVNNCVAYMTHDAIYRLLTISDKADKQTDGACDCVKEGVYVCVRLRVCVCEHVTICKNN